MRAFLTPHSVAAVLIVACSGAPQTARAPEGGRERKAAESAEAEGPADRLRSGWRHLEASRYGKAEGDFRAAASGSRADSARVGLAHVLLLTGRYEDAAATAAEVTQREHRAEAAWIRAEALRRRGELEEAVAVLREVEADPEARHARLLLGEVLLEQGLRAEAEAPLMTLIEDYNSERIGQDARGLAMVGRAAHLLRSPHDANDAFNEAERVATVDARALLWRAALFLENYDQGHAEEVVNEVLEKAPHHPEALVWLAHVKLAQALDFDAARELSLKALEINPRLSHAHFVLAGIELRDMELEEAERHVRAGLSHNPRDLDLLSMRAAIRFLADDEAGFRKATEAVLSYNPRYSRLYQIIGEYAEWEHRYEEIVEMMRHAVQMDAEDAKARAQLGFNLIRAGNDEEGLAALRIAFRDDPFNVRVFNTLNLYEKEIPESYESRRHGRFLIRYHRSERALLERYVPLLLDRAWDEFERAYGFRPTKPVGIELYPSREHFAIRTSGLPHTFIQGVCFGKTLAAITPKEEKFNLGMTLWHELAHVFHIQLSRSRVPRWFTEGLAEYETLVERPEWRRQHDRELFEALRSERLPQLGSMNRAFSHARDMGDMATAYYASTQIVRMLAEEHGRPALRRMMELWAEGRRTPEVLQEALGASPDELDHRFRRHLAKRLARYEQQFVPALEAPDLAVTRRAVEQEPESAAAQAQHAIAAMRKGEVELAQKAAAAALKADPDNPEALWLSSQLALAKEDAAAAHRLLVRLVRTGRDGYAVQMALAEVAEGRKNLTGKKAALEAAHGFDPSQAAPLRGLAALAAKARDSDGELAALKKLADLEQHDPRVYRRLLRLLLDRDLIDEATQVGEAAVYVDVTGRETHALYAEALAKNGSLDGAAFELESALLCGGRPKEMAAVHARLAEVQRERGDRQAALRHARKARELGGESPPPEALPPGN